MASITSWVDSRTLAFLIDPIIASQIYAKLEAEPAESLDATETAWIDGLERADQQASWILWSLMNGKVHPRESWVESYILHGKDLVLRQGPVESVTKVEAVQLCGDEAVVELAATEWCWVGNGLITFDSSANYGMGGCGQRVVKVHYVTKDTLPPGAVSNVAWLAEQHYLASTGQSCGLPERITSITRQGVSWTMLDPMDFLSIGLTGVGRLDAWLATARREHPSATMFDPYKSDRIRSERVAIVPTPTP